MRAHFEQATGLFIIDTPLPLRCVGYAGRGSGRNNPDLQSVRSVGPLPVGTYEVGAPFSHPRLGVLSFPLKPFPGQAMFGRSGFYIHGDNAAGDASRGCIILPRWMRQQIATQSVKELRVVRLLPMQETVRRTGT